MMDLRRLHVLRVLAAEGTVTATARAMYVTPSAVSQQLALLAAELGVPLLSRAGRRVRLTPAAHALLEHGDALQERWERARADVAAHGTGGHLRFCGVSSAIAALIAPAAARLRDQGIRVHVTEAESGDCFRLLLADRADVAVVLPAAGTPPVTDARFDQHVLHDDPQDLLVWAGHPLDRDGVTLADVAAEDWIVQPHDNDTHDLLLAVCAAAGFTPRIAQHAKEWFAVSALVAERFGVCLLPRLVPIPADHAVVRVPLHGDPRPTRKIIAAVRRGSADHPVIADALAGLRRYCR
jgi:DNA-binding transcriptional LysR family regulator